MEMEAVTNTTEFQPHKECVTNLPVEVDKEYYTLNKYYIFSNLIRTRI